MTQLEQVKALVARTADKTVALAKEIWEYAEISYEEFKSAAALIEALKAEGFTIEEGIADMPTAFTATYTSGSGKPVMALLAEYDALAGLSQKAACPVCDPVEPGGQGHGCGHNLLGAGCYSAAVALKDYMVEVSIDPASVKLKGEPEEIEEINHLMLAPIDLSEVVENKTTSFTRLLLVPDGLSLVKGQKLFAMVTLTLKGYDWMTLELDQDNLPENPLFTYPEQQFAVELFGEEDALRRVRASDATLELSYDLEELQVGDNVLPCRVVLADQSIYIDQSMEVTVNVTQEALDAALSADPDQPPVEPEA